MKTKKIHVSDAILKILIYICAGISVTMLAGMIIYIAAKGLKVVSVDFLTTETSVLNGTVGIAGNIVNTLIIILLTMLIATPVSLGAAVYLNEYAHRGRLVRIIEFATETLAGIPSIIFGLFGMMFFGQTLGLGYSLLTGSLTLIIMVLPLITRNAQEALKTVPDSYRYGAVGLGAGKWHAIRTILLPCAVPGILTGVILAIGRIIGESAALIYTAGSAKRMIDSLSELFPKIFESGGTMTTQLYLSATGEGDFDTAFGIAVVILVIVLLINAGTKLPARKFDVNRRT